VNSFLQLLDGFAGRSVIIAATNFEQALDPAIWRRFDDVLRLDLPNKEALRALLAKRLQPLRTTKRQVDGLLAKLAGASFADAERVCFDARKSCALDGSQSMRASDFEAALQRFSYRRSVLKRAAPGAGVPLVDRK
jgi:ATP-dependent Zn protease